MANVGSPASGFYPDRTANAGYVKDLFVKWISDTAGAIKSSTPFTEVVSITHTGTGAYTIQFSQAFNGTRNFTGNIAQAAGYDATKACRIQRVYDTTAPANGTLKILTVNAAGTATEPAANDVIELCYQVATATGYP